MDETHLIDNSDNDSVESWTMINQKKRDKASSSEQLEGSESNLRSPKKIREEDTDTDGISIISDEELEMPEIQDKDVSTSAEVPEVVTTPAADPIPPPVSLDFDYVCIGKEELSDDYFTSEKTRSYIHKRNNRISTILNTILVGAILTTTCLAVGHIWGTTDDCSSEMQNSKSELLFNLQELQQENIMLKNKIKSLETRKNSFRYTPMYQSMEHKKEEDGVKFNCECQDEFKELPNENLTDFIIEPKKKVEDIVPYILEALADDKDPEVKREYKRSIPGTYKNAHDPEYDSGFKYKQSKTGNVSMNNPKKNNGHRIKNAEEKRYKMFKKGKYDEMKYVKMKKIDNYVPKSDVDFKEADPKMKKHSKDFKNQRKQYKKYKEQGEFKPEKKYRMKVNY